MLLLHAHLKIWRETSQLWNLVLSTTLVAAANSILWHLIFSPSWCHQQPRNTSTLICSDESNQCFVKISSHLHFVCNFISSQLFCDFGATFVVSDVTGEQPLSYMIASVSKVGVSMFVMRKNWSLQDFFQFYLAHFLLLLWILAFIFTFDIIGQILVMAVQKSFYRYEIRGKSLSSMTLRYFNSHYFEYFPSNFIVYFAGQRRSCYVFGWNTSWVSRWRSCHLLWS